MAVSDGTLNRLKQLVGAGARANKYRVILNLPSVASGIVGSDEIDVLVTSAEMPGKTIGTIELHNQGRKLVIPGDTSYSNSWAVEMYLNETHNARRAMLKWMKACDNFQENVHASGSAYSDLLVTGTIIQLDSHGNEVVRYTMHNMWPSEVGAETMGDDAADTINKVSVTFTYSDWVTGTEDIDNPDDYTSAATGDAL